MTEATKIRWVGFGIAMLMISIGEWGAALAWFFIAMGVSLIYGAGRG